MTYLLWKCNKAKMSVRNLNQRLNLSLKTLPPLIKDHSLSCRSKNSQLSTLDSSEEVFPEWLLKRKDFIASQYYSKDEGNKKVSLICAKPASLREGHELNTVAFWLKTTPFGKTLTPLILSQLSKVFKTKTFFAKEKLIQEGTVGKCIFLILEGKVDVYKGDKLCSIIGEGNTIGNISLETGKVRSATVIAKTQVTALVLSAESYKSILFEHKYNKKTEILNFLKQVPCFFSCDERKLEQLADSAMSVYYSIDEVIYDVGQESVQFFIVKEGLVEIEKEITLVSKQNLPINQVLVSSRNFNHVERSCKPFEIFGSEEAVENIPRRSKAISKSKNTEVIFVFISKFNQTFKAEEKEMMQFYFQKRVSTKEVKRRISKEMSLENIKIKAIFDSTKITPMPGSFNDRKIDRKVTFANKLLKDYKKNIETKYLSTKFLIDKKEKLFFINKN